MSRTPRIYNPDERRFLEENLYCSFCGNAEAFTINLKLKHQLTPVSEGLKIELYGPYTDKVLKVISNNVDRILERAWDKGKPVFHCANCGEGEGLDLQGRVLDYCSNNCCPGCFSCGSYIEESEVVELCSQCIQEKEGAIEEDDCMYMCPWYDSGLLEVLDHYEITLKDLKEKLGY